MKYILVRFTKGLDCQAYQEIADGAVQRYLDLDGNELTLPLVTESYVVNPDYVTPEFANV